MSKVDNYYVRHFHTDSLANGVLRDSSEIYTNKNLFITGYEITLKPLSEGASIVENMTMDNYITLIEDGGVADIYCFPKGSYELSELVAEINELLNNRDNYYCELSIFVENSHFGVASFSLENSGTTDLYFDLSRAPDIKAIFNLPDELYEGETIGDSVVDITNGLQNIQFYCSLLQACSTRIGNNDNTLFCNFLIEDPFITCNNYTEHLKIPVYNLAHNVVFNVRTMGSTNSLARLQCSCDITLYLATFNDYFEHPLELGSVAFNESRGVFVDQMQVMNFEVTKARESLGLDSTLRLPENSYITRVNVMIKGEIYNVAEDQVLRINNSDLVIPKGSWTLDSLLSKLNESSAMFSLIEENKDAFRISISEYFNINFEGAQIIKKILGLGDAPDILTYSPGGLYYSLDSTNCEYYLEVNGLLLPMRMLTASEPLSEKAFFDLFISDVCDALGITNVDLAVPVVTDHYYNYDFSGSVETINVITESCENPLSKFHWFKGWNFRNKDASGASLIIPRYGSFYFDENIKLTHCLEYFEITNQADRKEFIVTATFTDKNNLPVGTPVTFDLSSYMGLNNTEQFLKDFAQSISTYFKSVINRSHIYFQAYDSNCRVAFSGSPTFIRAFHLSTSPKYGFDMYLDNTYHKGELIDFTGYTLFIEIEGYPPLDVHFNRKCNLRTYFSNIRMISRPFFMDTYNIEVNFLLYITPFGVAFSPTNAFKNSGLKYRFYGTVIDSGLLQGLHTSYDNCEDFVYTDYSNFLTHRINVGYTNLEGFAAKLQEIFQNEENSETVLPSLEFKRYNNNNELTVRNPKAMTGIILQGDSVLKYLGKDTGGRHRAPLYDENWFYPGCADIEVNNDNYQLSVLNVSTGESININFPLGFYDLDTLVTKLNGYLFEKGINIQFTKAQTGYSAISNVKYSLSGGLKDLLGITSNEEQTGFFIKYLENATLGESHGEYEYVCNDLFDITNGMDHLDIYSNCIRGLGVNNKLCGLVIDNLSLNYTSLQTLLPCKNTLNEIEFELKDANGSDYAFSGCCDIALTIGSVAK